MTDEELKNDLESKLMEAGIQGPDLTKILNEKPPERDLELFFERVKAGDANIRREALNDLLAAIPSDKKYTERHLLKNGRDYKMRERKLSQRSQMSLFWPTSDYRPLSPDLDHETLNAVLFINAKTKATKNRRVIFTKTELLREIGYPDDQIRRGGSIWQKADEIMDKLWDNEWRFEGRGRKGEMREYKLRIITGVSRPKGEKRGGEGEYEVILNFDLAPHVSMLGETVADVSQLRGEYVMIPESVRRDRSGKWRSLELWLQAMYGARPFKIKCEKLLLKSGVSRDFVVNRLRGSVEKLFEILEEMKKKGFLSGWDLDAQANAKTFREDVRKWTITLYPQKRKKITSAPTRRIDQKKCTHEGGQAWRYDDTVKRCSVCHLEVVLTSNPRR